MVTSKTTKKGCAHKNLNNFSISKTKKTHNIASFCQINDIIYVVPTIFYGAAAETEEE